MFSSTYVHHEHAKKLHFAAYFAKVYEKATVTKKWNMSSRIEFFQKNQNFSRISHKQAASDKRNFISYWSQNNSLRQDVVCSQTKCVQMTTITRNFVFGTKKFPKIFFKFLQKWSEWTRNLPKMSENTYKWLLCGFNRNSTRNLWIFTFLPHLSVQHEVLLQKWHEQKFLRTLVPAKF